MSNETSATGFHHGPRRLVAEIGIVAAVLALGIWGGAAVLRWAAVRAVEALPVSVDQSLGKAAAGQFTWPDCGGEPSGALAELAARFRPHVPEAFRGFRARIVDAKEVNAFALPGGNLYVLRGLVHSARRTEEVAGVLAHEVGHAVLRHGVRRIARQAGISLALALVVGSQEGVVDTLLSGAAQLQSLRFDRDEEREADRFGLELCALSGIAPTALGEFLGRLPDGASVGAPEWLSTHPSSAQRRSDLERMLRERPAPRSAGPPLPSLERLRAPCG